MQKKLHPLQQQILDLLVENSDDPLTIREIQDAVNASSTSVIAHHLTQLEKKGYLKRNPFNPRDYQVLKGGPEKQVTYINLYGLAQCGPDGAILDGNPIDRIPISARLLPFPAEEAFMVKAKGDSMEPKISEGDLVIAKKTNDADNNSIVICANKGESLIKKIKKEKDDIILISINSEKYQPFLADRESFKIEGEVKTVITNKLP
jgi:repressor LexA